MSYPSKHQERLDFGVDNRFDWNQIHFGDDHGFEIPMNYDSWFCPRCDEWTMVTESSARLTCNECRKVVARTDPILPVGKYAGWRLSLVPDEQYREWARDTLLK